MGEMADLHADMWDDYYEYEDREPEIATNAKVLHSTPLAMLIKCDDGIAWFPRKVAHLSDDILCYDWWFDPQWEPTNVSEIEGDF